MMALDVSANVAQIFGFVGSKRTIKPPTDIEKLTQEFMCVQSFLCEPEHADWQGFDEFGTGRVEIGFIQNLDPVYIFRLLFPEEIMIEIEIENCTVYSTVYSYVILNCIPLLLYYGYHNKYALCGNER